MISLLAPSKTMDISPLKKRTQITSPHFMLEAKNIAGQLATTSDSVTLMQVSDAIADNVTHMYREWGSFVKPSIFMYKGDVYKGVYSHTLTDDDITWAQDNLMILSGLYGLLRPLDEISQYRLEMKAKLPINGAKNLYEFWGDKLAKYADERAEGIICMLSSEEYARPVRKYACSRIVTPIFMDHKPNGTVGPVPIYSKMMRGVMARWMIDHRITTPEGLKEFDGFDYHFDPKRSTPDAPVFVRIKMTPLVF